MLKLWAANLLFQATSTYSFARLIVTRAAVMPTFQSDSRLRGLCLRYATQAKSTGNIGDQGRSTGVLVGDSVSRLRGRLHAGFSTRRRSYGFRCSPAQDTMTTQKN